MSVTESDIECSMDSDSDVTEPKARSRPSSSQSIRSEAMMYDFEVRLCCLSFFFFTIVLCSKHLYSFQHFQLRRLGIESKY